jgi:cobalt/nickel transport system permease protein
MRDRIYLLMYFIAVLAITSFHRLGFLLACLVLVIGLAGKRSPAIFKKTLAAVLAFNLVVSVSYIVLSVWSGRPFLHYLALLNLRVFTLTLGTFLAFERINLFKALAFSRSLSHLLVLAYSQTLTIRRLFEEFRLALRSRSLNRPGFKRLYRHGASTGAYLTHKSLNDIAEITQAMKSRGFFND